MEVRDLWTAVCPSQASGLRPPASSVSFFQFEDVAPRLEVVLLAGVVGAAHAVDDGVRDLVDRREQERLDGALLLGRQLAEARALAAELVLGDAPQLVFERPDRRADVEVPQRLLEL